jgi:hypothetical protein
MTPANVVCLLARTVRVGISGNRSSIHPLGLVSVGTVECDLIADMDVCVKCSDGTVIKQLDHFVAYCHDSRDVALERFSLSREAREWSGLLQEHLIDFEV